MRIKGLADPARLYNGAHMANPPLRLVLFGPPGAGKTALLGSLLQAAQLQESSLGGKLLDKTGVLEELKKKVYSKKDLTSKNAVEYYPATWETPAGPVEVQLVDFSPPTTEKLLESQLPLTRGVNPAAQEILQADALVYVADPTAGGASLEKDFKDFCQFVRTLEETRGTNVEVAGLPIFLVLSKVDQMAKATDTGIAWIQRVEDGKRRMDLKYQQFLEKQEDRQNMAFGTADVHLWATAVKRPALADRPARPQEPYGVAELFRQVLDSARKFQENRESSRHWLQTLLVGFLGILLIMGLISLALFLGRPDPEVALLESRISAVLGNEAIREPIDERLEEIRQFQENPLFSQVSPAIKDQVFETQKEIEQYQAYLRAFLAQVPDLRGVKDAGDLKRVQRNLKDFQIPDDLEKRWADTWLMKRRQQVFEDVDLLQAAIHEEEAWFKKQRQKGLDLVREFAMLLQGDARDRWLKEAKAYVKEQPRFRETDRIPGTTVFYKTVYRFDPVAKVKQDWEKTRIAVLNLTPE